MTLIVPYFAQAQTAAIVIDGVTYRVPLIDSAGHLQVDVVTSTLPALAATSAKQDTMITALQLIDDLRGALAAVHADRLNVNAYATGASEVKAAYSDIISSIARTTLVTPTSGKKIRVISTRITFDAGAPQRAQIYFGTGADIATNPEKVVDEFHNGSIIGTKPGMVWPDGGGPVGAVDEVLSIRCVMTLAETVRFLVVYREE